MSAAVIDLQQARQRRRARLQLRNQEGEFHSNRSLQEKLRIVRAVAEEAVELDPEKCSDSISVPQSRWNDARALLEPRYGRIPQASEITRQIRIELREPKLSWAIVLALAHEPERRIPHLLKRAGDDTVDALPAPTIVFALTLVARYLNMSTLTPQRYSEGRRTLLRSRRRTSSGDRYLRTVLPSADRIITALGNWPRALALAGLEQATPLERARAGLPVPDAITLFYAETGELPNNRKQLSRFAETQGFSLQTMRGKQWAAWLTLGRERIAEHPQLPTPGP